jgi:hypothetical protein
VAEGEVEREVDRRRVVPVDQVLAVDGRAPGHRAQARVDLRLGGGDLRQPGGAGDVGDAGRPVGAHQGAGGADVEAQLRRLQLDRYRSREADGLRRDRDTQEVGHQLGRHRAAGAQREPGDPRLGRADDEVVGELLQRPVRHRQVDAAVAEVLRERLRVGGEVGLVRKAGWGGTARAVVGVGADVVEVDDQEDRRRQPSVIVERHRDRRTTGDAPEGLGEDIVDPVSAEALPGLRAGDDPRHGRRHHAANGLPRAPDDYR